MHNITKTYVAGMSIPELSSATGLARSTIRVRLKRAGVVRTRADGVRLAGAKGKLGGGYRGKTVVFSPAHRAALKVSAIARGEATARGISTKPNGYVEITRGPNKGRSVHRVRAERKLGRRLLPTEVVHHRNEVRGDNRHKNLQVMSRAEHTAHHRNAGV